MSGFTKEIIIRTLFELLNEKPLAKITVKDIVERCGVNPVSYTHLAFLRVNETTAGKYCLVAVDIEHFKLFNEWYCQVAGDKLLREIGAHLNKMRQEFGGIAGYMGGDDFVIVLPNDEMCIRDRCYPYSLEED